jgi:predicted nucleic acid-binding Zn ribbon protein
MSPYRRAPRSLALALGPLREALAPETLLAEIQRAWADAVGEAIAAEAHPSGERSGVVTVTCSASVWAHELDLMGPVIVERLNGRVTRGQVTRLRCVSTAPARAR